MEWLEAFKKGLVVFLWSILWGLAGLTVAAIISGGAILTITTTFPMKPYTPEAVSRSLGILLTATAGIIVGGIITAIGNYATVVKYSVEAAIEEFKRETET